MGETRTTNGQRASGLVRALGVWAASAIVVGAMIGQGIFLYTSQMARDAGSINRVLAAWLAGGVIVLFGAFCYAELGAAMPEAGGDFVYLSRGLGPLWGFLFGWTKSLLMTPSSIAAISAGLMRFTGFLFPVVAAPILTWRIPGLLRAEPYLFTVTLAQVLAALVIAAMAIINYFGVRTAGRIQIVLTGLKVAAVITVIVLGLTFGKVTALQLQSGAPFFEVGMADAFLSALVPVMAAYNGFQYLGTVGAEIVNPQKNLPRAAIFGLLTVITFYLLINIAYFKTLSFSDVARSQHVASDAVVTIIGRSGATWLTIAMMISALGAIHVNFLTGPRVPYAMARDGQFFRFVKRIQPMHKTPSGALLFQACITIVLVLTGTFEELYSLSVFSVWIFFLLTAVSLIRLRSVEPTLSRPYRAWGYPWTALVFGGASLAMTATLWLRRPGRSSIGVAVILLGIPFYYYWRRRPRAGHRSRSLL